MSVEEKAAAEADAKGLTGDERERYIGGAINKARHFLHRRVDGKPPPKSEYEQFLEKKKAAEAEAKAESEKRAARQEKERKIAEIDRQIEAKTHEKRHAEEAWEVAKSRHRPMQTYTGVPSRQDTRIKNKLNKSADEHLLALQDAFEAKQRELSELHRKRRELVYSH